MSSILDPSLPSPPPLGVDSQSVAEPGPDPSSPSSGDWGGVPCSTILTLMKIPAHKTKPSRHESILQEFCFPFRPRAASQELPEFSYHPVTQDRPRLVTRVKSPSQTQCELSDMDPSHGSPFSTDHLDLDGSFGPSIHTDPAHALPEPTGFLKLGDDMFLPFGHRETEVLDVINSDRNRCLRSRLISCLGQHKWDSIRVSLLNLSRAEMDDGRWLSELKMAIEPLDPSLWVALAGLLGADLQHYASDSASTPDDQPLDQRTWSIQPVRVKGLLKPARSHSFPHSRTQRVRRLSPQLRYHNHRSSLQSNYSLSSVFTDSDQESSVCPISPRNPVMECIMESNCVEDDGPESDVASEGSQAKHSEEEDVEDVGSCLVGLRILDSSPLNGQSQPEQKFPNDSFPDTGCGYSPSPCLKYSFGDVEYPGLGFRSAWTKPAPSA